MSAKINKDRIAYALAHMDVALQAIGESLDDISNEQLRKLARMDCQIQEFVGDCLREGMKL